jgi:hypothetical protein
MGYQLDYRTWHRSFPVSKRLQKRASPMCDRCVYPRKLSLEARSAALYFRFYGESAVSLQIAELVQPPQRVILHRGRSGVESFCDGPTRSAGS